MKKLLLLSFVVLSYFNARSQITVSDGQTAQQLAEMLVGQGVQISNPTINGTCPGTARGKFDFTGPSLIGIDSGIVLTCGRVVTSGTNFGVNATYNDFANNQFSTGFPGAPGDDDLTALANQYTGAVTGTNDACVLEFDFIPSGDTVKFDYVFASEEYNCPTCNGFGWNYNCSINDVFGFFISGPGYATPTNIALVPGTNVMVGVSTVNDGVPGFPNTPDPCFANTFGAGPYTGFYNSNAGGTVISYTGYTDVFTAVAKVQPCMSYHLKLAIADYSDASYDSGVFIKAGSLMTTKVKLTPATGGGQNNEKAHSVRGCKPAKIAFGRSTCDSTVSLTYQLQLGGTAVNGVDYATLPNTFTIPANTNTDTMIIQAKNVQYPSGNPLFVTVGVYNPDSVAAGAPNPPIVSRDTVWIYDSLYVNIPTDPMVKCPRDTFRINSEMAAGLNYSWSPAALILDPSLQNIKTVPSVTTPYKITVTQPGAPATCPPVSRTYVAVVEPIPQITLVKERTECLPDSLNINLYAEPGNINYTWSWTPADYLRDDFSPNNKFYAAPGDYKYVVTATTPVAHCSNKDSMLIHVVPPFEFESVTPVDTTIHYGDQIKLSSRSEAIYWQWDPVTYLSDALAREPLATPLEDMQYRLIGMNQYGCTDTALVKIKVEYDTRSGMPNAFSPNGDGMNDVFKIQNLRFDKMTEFRIFNRWGRQVFETNIPTKGWDGTINGKPAAPDVYYYLIKLTLPGGVPKVLKGDVTLVR
ncbi:choice-of-anchor L domain-containing protein [Taibaiella koreensis]|uniref:choice-of-anchor L domain-containing protein n=1 Tax=Taibaiella koreensis TaxID=1268548 RepID=UPI000E59D423|nr:choice-of-anchor L domain-containing protein [Taibaiella koreensis]